ncbi:sortase domain-containing protein [Actinomadura rudentiformis]|uniref:Class F sortase n=1 Tax=Actinomadura rudentiformis TaxID=359158 RepID=A0A6H9YZ32_9ACTN|nr:sortase [Actinomadura rudentiformis]KAB2351813.1 class F sortase [Actinomadura rudentiformis]
MSDRCRRVLGTVAGRSQIVIGCALRGDRTVRRGAQPAAGRPAALPGTLGRSQPVSIAIPNIGVNAPLAGVGTTASGRIEVPPLDEHNMAGWYARGASPGEPGAAVIAGRVGTTTGPAVFARLRELAQGDIVGVVREDETVAVFRITSAEQISGGFPAECLRRGAPELRLIACAGLHDDAWRSHPDHLIVHGSFAAAYRVSDLLDT